MSDEPTPWTDDEKLARDLEYLAARTYGIPGDVERAATFRQAAARIRELERENARLVAVLTKVADAYGNDETTARFCKGLARETLTHGRIAK